MNSMLRIENLKIAFETPGLPFYAVNGLDLTVPEGSFTALAGRSGCGKTVTALSICRLIRSCKIEGSIRFYSHDGEKDLLTLPERDLRAIRGIQIGYIFQDPASSLNPVLRVGDQMGETYLAHFDVSGRQADEKGRQALERARIKDVERVWRAFPHELSGGMKQRVMIAMALVLEPRLLIADEPTTALDATTASEIMDLLAAIQKERSLSVFFITHDLPLAAAFSETIVVMEGGKLIERLEKTPRWEPRETHTKRLFEAGLLNVPPKSRMEA